MGKRMLKYVFFCVSECFASVLLGFQWVSMCFSEVFNDFELFLGIFRSFLDESSRNQSFPSSSQKGTA